MRKGFTGLQSVVTNAWTAHHHHWFLNKKKHKSADMVNINGFLGLKETSYRFLENAIQQNHLHPTFSKKNT